MTESTKLTKESDKFDCEKNVKTLLTCTPGLKHGRAGEVDLDLARDVVLGQKLGCASGEFAGDAEVVAPRVAVLHAESASSCSVRAAGVDGEREWSTMSFAAISAASATQWS